MSSAQIALRGAVVQGERTPLSVDDAVSTFFMSCAVGVPRAASTILARKVSAIGSNDLTQLTLGVDRDSTTVAPLFDERNDAVKWSSRFSWSR